MKRRNLLLDRILLREIPFLMHFTRAENLGSILEHGLQPRATLDQHKVGYHYSDSWRNDGYLEAISLSVSSYNLRMLNAVRARMPGTHWVVLGLDPQLVLGTTCHFCATNAASGRHLRTNRKLSGPWAFEAMFENWSPFYRGASYRDDFDFPDFLPTDPQAEILHFGPVSPAHLRFVMTDQESFGEPIQQMLNSLPGAERDVMIHPFQSRFRTPHGLWG